MFYFIPYPYVYDFYRRRLSQDFTSAVFYRLPKPPKHPKFGRPKKYGDRLNIRHLQYKTIAIGNKDAQIASHLVRTKMCPVDVRLVVIRTRPKPSKP